MEPQQLEKLAKMAHDAQARRTHTFELLLSGEKTRIEAVAVDDPSAWEEPLEDFEVGFQDIEPMTLREWDARIQELLDWRENGGRI